MLPKIKKDQRNKAKTESEKRMQLKIEKRMDKAQRITVFYQKTRSKVQAIAIHLEIIGGEKCI